MFPKLVSLYLNDTDPNGARKVGDHSIRADFDNGQSCEVVISHPRDARSVALALRELGRAVFEWIPSAN